MAKDCDFGVQYICHECQRIFS